MSPSSNPPAGRPAVGATLWLLVVAVASILAIGALADIEDFAQRAAEYHFIVVFGAQLATGVFAIVAAFQLSAPGRSLAWAALPVPTSLLWFAYVTEMCIETWTAGIEGKLSETAECFGFLVAVGTPLAVSILIPLYRKRPASPVYVAAIAGLGVSALAAFLLNFFHTYATTPMDVLAHGLAMLILIAAAAWSPRLLSSL